MYNINFLLAEHEGHTGQYWPDSVAIRLMANLNYLYNINLLLTAHEGNTGEYKPEVVTVRPSTTKGQYAQYSSSRLG